METDCFVKVAVEEALRGCGGGWDMETDCGVPCRDRC